MKKTNLFSIGILILLLSAVNLLIKEDAPHIHRQKCIGGTGDEIILYMIKLNDGNYLSCGYTDSHNGDFNANHGRLDAFLVKTDNGGNIIWEQTYGGNYDETFYNIIETTNGDIIAVGTSGSDKITIGPTGSNNQQPTGLHGQPGTDDVWLVRTNSNGDLIKQLCYGGSGSESTFDLGMSEGLLISKNGYILFTGETNSNDGDLSNKPHHGDYDGWVVKLDAATFGIVNSVTIGDEQYDALYNINEINGYFLVTGTKATKKYAGPYHDSIENYYKAFAAKLDTSTLTNSWGNIRIYGGSGSDDCNASVVSSDDNLVLTGHAASSDRDCIKNKGFNTWTWKINVSNGDTIWQNFTGIFNDTSAAFNIIATRDGGFVAVGGIVHTTDPFVPDAYALKIDANGKTQWTKRFGGSGFDQILSGVEENDGNILLGGWTSSIDGDVSGYHSSVPVVSQKYFHFPRGKGTSKRKIPTQDVWLVELSPN
jgi:hypothetical protein